MKKKHSKTKKKKSFSFSKFIIFTLLILIFILSGFIAGYILSETKTQKEIKKYQNTLVILQQKINTLSKEIKTLPLNHINKSKTSTVQSSEILDFLNSQKPKKNIKQTKNNNSAKLFSYKKPKLVIILDDVSFNYQVKAIKSIPLNITPSFFPPTKVHPYTPVYAKEFKVYMVHVPMQAVNYPHPEPDTMDINWSYIQIKNRINQIKKWFPNAKFINNHTGSKFTANLKEMKKLFKVLKEDDLGFVDSKTTRYSKAKDAEKIYKIPFYSRDIFLDDRQNIKYIQNQLKKAVEIAKKRGYAIAIGHPHSTTIQALKESQNILKNVDVITINRLYNLTWKK